MTQVQRSGGPWILPGESVLRQQLEPLAFGQVAWRDDLKVAAVQGGDLVQVELSASAITQASTTWSRRDE